MKEAYDFLRNCGTFYLATDDNGQPRVRPFGAISDYEGKLYIDTRACFQKHNPMNYARRIRIHAK